MNKFYFREGDIVLFNWKPSCAKWKRGKVLGNNFPMCNLPDFVGEAVYYIGEIDENGKVICGQKSYAIPADSKYLYLYRDEYSWCIGKSANEVDHPYEKDPLLDDEKRCLEPYDIIMVNYNGTWELDMFQNYINKDRTQIHTFKGHLILFDDNWDVYDDKKFMQLFNLDDNNVTKGAPDKIGKIDKTVYIPYTSCQELSEDDYAQGDAVKVSDGRNPDYYYWTTSASTEECDKPDERTNTDKIIDLLDYNVELLLELTKLIEKLNDKVDKMNPIFPFEPVPWTPGSPSSPWYDKIWWDKNKVYCDDYTTYTSNHTYTAHIKPEDMDKYKEMFTNTSTDKFNYKKYNDMSTCNDTKDSECYEPKKASSLIDDKYDTWGISCAAGKITEDKEEDSND